MQRVLTTGEVARFCGVNFRTVLRWIERGQLVAYRLPGRGDHRIKMDDFLAFMAEHNLPIPEEFSPKQARILVVDDEEHYCRSIRRILERSGYDVMTANDGFRAGALMGAFYPAIMTLDLRMNGVDGFEVLSFVKSQRQFENTKIVIISGMGEEMLEKAKHAGADE
jgi:excisionase family DNA binding protein